MPKILKLKPVWGKQAPETRKYKNTLQPRKQCFIFPIMSSHSSRYHDNRMFHLQLLWQKQARHVFINFLFLSHIKGRIQKGEKRHSSGV